MYVYRYIKLTNVLVHYGCAACRSVFIRVIFLPCVVNARGSFLMTKYSLIEMKKRNYGRILLVASMAGKEVMIQLQN